MKKIAIWASAHEITEEQRKELLLTFSDVVNLSSIDELLQSEMSRMNKESSVSSIAEALSGIAFTYNAMIIQPAGNPRLQYALGVEHVPVLYAFSERVSEDITQPDGSVRKVSVFKHIYFQ